MGRHVAQGMLALQVGVEWGRATGLFMQHNCFPSKQRVQQLNNLFLESLADRKSPRMASTKIQARIELIGHHRTVGLAKMTFTVIIVQNSIDNGVAMIGLK